MKHVDEDGLILFYYGEHATPEQVRTHLDGCSACADGYRKLERLLDSVEPAALPERDDGYERRVWARLEPRLQPRRSGLLSWLTPPRLALAGGLAALLLIAFFYGQHTGRQGMQALTAESRERILMQTVAAHLERSELALIELTNTAAGPGVDLRLQRERAARLASANRIYRTAAQHAGQDSLALLLEELEHVLLEISNSANSPDVAEFHRLWRRVESSGLRIKLKLMGTETRRRAGQPVPLTERT